MPNDKDPDGATALMICPATSHDLDQVVALDARVTGTAKPEYWRDIFERYGARRPDERIFLVAKPAGGDDTGADEIFGFIVGEVRGWEFGSEPCGWVFAVTVDPDQREQHIGERLFRDICARFRQVGIGKVRNMVRRDDTLVMSFFRSEGMVAGPYIQLELDLNDLD